MQCWSGAPVAVQPKGAAGEAQGVVRQEGRGADRPPEQQREGGVVQQVAARHGAPEEVRPCTAAHTVQLVRCLPALGARRQSNDM